jgi:hypothetical protein
MPPPRRGWGPGAGGSDVAGLRREMGPAATWLELLLLLLLKVTSVTLTRVGPLRFRDIWGPCDVSSGGWKLGAPAAAHVMTGAAT